jgi:type IV secretory pathway component VirB8
MNATGDRVQTHRVKLHVSYKKHLLSSYVNSDEAYEPNAAEKNTIATVDSAVFQSGFVEYARYMAGKIIKRGQTDLRHRKNISVSEIDTYKSAKTIWHYIFARLTG